MDFIDQLRALAQRIPKQLNHIQTEEATKSALVMPFISALGYDVFDPSEVVPEFTADIGTKKGEKVDYAIIRDGKPILLFECKKAGTNLSESHSSQLFRYFTVTDGRFGVLTDGITYRFFSDLEKQNCMDSKPFLVINLLELEESLIKELKKFTKASFNVDEIVETAGDLKYTREIMKLITDEWKSPSDEFVRLFASKVYSGRMTKTILEQFQKNTKSAFHSFVSDRIKGRLESALAQESQGEDTPKLEDEPLEEESSSPESDGIVTTEEEIEAFYIVKSILRETIDSSRVVMRDAKSYCAILLDDNNRKPICRLHFNGPVKRIGLLDENKKETRFVVETLDEIYQHAGPLAATVFRYDNG